MPQHPALPYLRTSEKGKVISAEDAVRLIRPGDTIATGGFVGIGFAEELAIAIERAFLTPGAGDDFAIGDVACVGLPLRVWIALLAQ